MKKAGAFVNPSCGLHVHIGAGDFTARQLRNLLKYMASREEIFYAAFNVHEDRKRYCRPARKRLIEKVCEENPATLDEVKDLWYGGLVHHAGYRYDDSRYTIVNLHAFFNKGTIEYRIFNSTLDSEEVKSYIQFCLAMTHTAKITTYSVYKPLTDRFAQRMKWILEGCGLDSKEFATCHYHLLKHLKGAASAVAVA